MYSTYIYIKLRLQSDKEEGDVTAVKSGADYFKNGLGLVRPADRVEPREEPGQCLAPS